MYSPILRNRQSERLGFKHLSKNCREHVMPLFDVAAPTKASDQAKGQAFVARNIARTGSIVNNLRAVFVDSSELDPSFRLADGAHPLIAAANAIANSGVRPIPVTGLHRDETHNAATFAISKVQAPQEVCLRLDATDASTATLTSRRIESFLSEHSTASSLTYLLLDMQCLYGTDKDAVARQIRRLLDLLSARAWAGIIIGGYGLPDQLSSAVQTNEQRYLPRIEQDVFYDLATHAIDAEKWFADYTILPPSVVELDWKLIQRVMAPKALYTLGNTWFIVRGGAFSSHADGYDQYYSIAGGIVALDEYCGQDYSYGDKHIWERSQRIGTPGNPASWITAGVNHHITFTAETHAK